jgi:hypothetical protein
MLKAAVARIKSVNRYILVVGAGLAIAVVVLVVLGFVWSDEAFGEGWRQTFYQGLLTSACFFGLLGIAAVVQQVSASRGDILRKRVEYLFSTRRSVSPPLVDYVEKLVKRNALYSSETQNLVEILEYNSDYKAYRVSMRKSFQLHNVFGDLPQDEQIRLNFAPDLISTTVEPLAEVTVIRSIQGGQVTYALDERLPIPAAGLKRNIRIALRPGEVVTIEHEHWTWATNVGNSGFGLSRFSEHTSVVVRNRSLVTARIKVPPRHDEASFVSEELSLKNGEEATIRDRTNVPEMTRLDFYWLPPVEYPEAAEPDRTGISEVLQWNPSDPSP